MQANAGAKIGYLKISHLSLNTSMLVCALLLLTAIISQLATPKFKSLGESPVLENVIPKAFDEWQDKPSQYVQAPVNTVTQAISDATYDQVLMRTYQNKSGNQIMLAIAYAREQRQEIKIHQPEVCYQAQGYEMLDMRNQVFNLKGYTGAINGKQLIFKKNNLMEAVSYWIRLGDIFPMTGLQMRLKIFKDGLKGNIDDGVLVRVSTLINNQAEAPAAYQAQEKFLTDLTTAVTVKTPNLLVPSTK